MRKTYLMSKLFSDSTPTEFKDKVMNKIEEARENGSSELKEGEDDLKMECEDGDSVKITDKAHNDDVTVASENPDDPNDTQLKAESETAPDVEVPANKAQDGEHTENTAPSVEVTANVGRTEDGKTGVKSYSIKFYGNQSFNDILRSSKAISRAFSDVPAAVDNTVKEIADNAGKKAEEITDPQEQNKQFDEDEQTVKDNAVELAKAADDLAENKDPELAKKVKSMAEDVMAQCDQCEAQRDECDMSEVRTQCKKFSDDAQEIINKSEKEEEKKQADEDKKELDKKVEKVEEKAKEADSKEGAEDLKKECDAVKAECDEFEQKHPDVDTKDVKDKLESFSKKADDLLRTFSNPSHTGEQRIFSDGKKRTSLNPYLFS